ncbi:hypothetical protein DIE14_08610 [Burkholderia sp. Bp9017]|nr:hypothetical protein DIE14_08610 [Burkholderia sp. Bp9017]RQZ35206.1 hypothetical protein DIE13_10835 [Burkholderia sp. Bp9016]
MQAGAAAAVGKKSAFYRRAGPADRVVHAPPAVAERPGDPARALAGAPIARRGGGRLRSAGLDPRQW